MLVRTISKLTTKLTLLIGTSLALVAGGVATFISKTTTAPAKPKPQARIKLQTNHRTIKFSDAVSLAAPTLEQSSARPLTLVAADFDEDGTPDLLSGATNGGVGVLSFYRGNVEAIYPTPNTAKNALPFFPAEQFVNLPVAPDLLVTGDFNADGHFDVVTAARNGSALYLLAGDGKGGFAEAVAMELSGAVTALAAGEINRVDGLADLAVALDAHAGASVVLLTAADGAWSAQPQSYALAQPATSLEFAHLTRDGWSDLALTAGNELVVFEGGSQAPRMTRTGLAFDAEALAVGRFTDSTQPQIALLARDGSVSVASYQRASERRASSRSRSNSGWQVASYISEAAAQTENTTSRQLLRARVSTSQHDDLLTLRGQQLQFVTNNEAPQRAATTLEGAVDLVAALPIRTNASALHGLVLLSRHHTAPLLIQPLPEADFTVDSTADLDDLTPGDGICNTSLGCTLRAAIQQANVSPGPDRITFNLPAGSQITLGQVLPDITEALTIEATAAQAIALVASGQITGGTLLRITGGNSTVRGLTINALRGVTGVQLLRGGNNRLEGNTIQGGARGLLIDQSAANVIGGTTAAARNIISGNFGEGILISGFDTDAARNVIQGNYIGVDATGSGALGNGATGILLQTDSTTIGGTMAGSGNIIANNGGQGVAIQIWSANLPNDFSVNNAIQGNSIYNNSGLGIDLESSLAAVTPNDPGDADAGNNNLQNFPLITSALTRATGTTIAGTLNSTANSTFTIELFNNVACDTSGNGEGEAFLARTTVTTNAAGLATFNVATSLVPAGRFITATATDANGNTSEFSACRVVENASADLVVTQTATPNPVNVGNNLTFNLTVTNAGPDDATGVTLTNAISIPNGQFTVVSVTPSQGTCTGVNCSLGTILSTANATVSIVITPTIPTAGTPPNSVTATNIATVVSNEQDPVTANNTNATSATVNAVADLAITQIVDTTVTVNSTLVTYTITITNNGPSTANSVSGQFTPPTILQNVTCTAPPGWSCNRDGNPFYVFAPNQAPGTANVAVFTLRGSTGCLPQSTVISNSVGISSSTVDVNSDNNTATLTRVLSASLPLGSIGYDGSTSLALRLGPVVAGSTGTPPSGTFTVTNSGCVPFDLSSAQFVRAGITTNLAGLDDSRYFSLRLVLASGAELPLNPTPNSDRNAAQIIPIRQTLQGGQTLRFRVLFNPPLPLFAGTFALRDQGVFASQVLPESFASSLVFNSTGILPLPVNISATVSPAIQIIPRDGNAIGTSTTPLVIMETLRGDFRVRVSMYDANKNPTRITYQFFDTFRQPASNPIAVDLTSLVSSSPILPGQAFTLQQDFSGAAGRPDIVYVRVTVNDGDGTTVVATSSPFLPALTATSALRAFTPEAAHSDVITLPALRIDGSADTRHRQTGSRSGGQ